MQSEAVGGSFVSGRLNPRANKDVRSRNLTSWAFALQRESEGGRFELVNLRDSVGRLFGALRIASGFTAGPPSTTHSLAIELLDTGTGVTLTTRHIQVHVVNQTVLEVLWPRVRAFTAGNAHMYGKKTPTGSDVREPVAAH